MRANAEVVVEADGANLRYTVLRSDPPLLLRPTADALMLVGGSAGPLGGDDLMLTVTVGRGAHLRVRSAAATCLLPRQDTPSSLRIDASVASGGSLTWIPEPTISIAGSDHRQRTTIELADDADLRWDERLVLGRWNEEPGELRSSIRVERNGRALTHQELRIDARARSRTIVGAAREIHSELVVGSASDDHIDGEDEDAVTFRLADDAILRQRVIGGSGDGAGVPRQETAAR